MKNNAHHSMMMVPMQMSPCSRPVCHLTVVFIVAIALQHLTDVSL